MSVIDRVRLRHYLGLVKHIVTWQLARLNFRERRQVVYCLGDSHVEMFEHLQAQQKLTDTLLRFVQVGGATAMGMVNPNSKTDALRIFRYHVRFIPRQSKLLIILGEVDCGFVIWYRAEKYQVPVSNQLEESLKNYAHFLLDLKRQGYHNIIVSCVPMPTILDGQTWGEVANARSEVKATLLERTELTRTYNQKLRAFCAEQGFQFLDFETEVIDPTTGIVKDKFRNQNQLDHHLDPVAMESVLVPALGKLGLR